VNIQGANGEGIGRLMITIGLLDIPVKEMGAVINARMAECLSRRSGADGL
jgi:hypothetical protein